MFSALQPVGWPAATARAASGRPRGGIAVDQDDIEQAYVVVLHRVAAIPTASGCCGQRRSTLGSSSSSATRPATSLRRVKECRQGSLPAHPTAFHVLVVRLAGENVAAAISLDFRGDCGIYNVATLQHARRRGLGTALTALHVQRAGAHGCSTATLQPTATAERVYARVGFHDLGRILEYAR